MSKIKQAITECPNEGCDNQGFIIGVDGRGEPEQIQCQFCYENEFSVFNQQQRENKISEQEARNEIATAKN